ncbi:MAG: hypothetical protein C0483_17735 [Pirellula sp.]|nr:hypothetical protein [Pirellula sp.]
MIVGLPSRYSRVRTSLAPSLRRWVVAALLTACTSLRLVSAAEVPLARFAPSDIGLCIEAEGLHQHVEAFLNGPLYERWRAFPPLAQWHDEQRAQLTKMNSVLKANLGLSWDDLRSRLFGRQWLLAVYPPASVSEEHGRTAPHGFLVLRAAEAPLLEKAVEKLLAALRKDDRYHRSSTAGFGNRSYTVHEFEDESKQPLFLVYDGDFGCLATDREKLEQVLARYSTTGDADSLESLADSAEYQAAAKTRPANSALRLFVQAKSWRSYYAMLLERDGEKGDDVARKFAEVWSHLKFLAADAELAPTLRIEIEAAWDDEGISDELRAFLAAQAKGEATAAAIPADCLAAVSGRLDIKKLADVMMAFQRQIAERHGRRVPTEAVLAARLAGGLGPGFTAYAVPGVAYAAKQTPAERAKVDGELRVVDRYWPVDWVVGFDTQPFLAGEPTLADTVDPLLRLGLVLAADAYNADRKPTARVVSSKVGELSISGLTGIGPFDRAGVFMAHNADRLWFAGSPEVLARAAEAKPRASLAENALYKQVRGSRSTGASQFLFINLQELRRTANAVVDAPPAWMALVKTEAAQKGVRELNTLLSLADAALLEAAVETEHARVSLAVGVAEAMP